MLNYFPKFFSSRAIYCYLITLALVSLVFMNHVMPFQFMLFGIAAVLFFFLCSNRLTIDWQRFGSRAFVQKLFFVGLMIRVVYVVFIYFYYVAMTGNGHAYHAADELLYQLLGEMWRNEGFERMKFEMKFMPLSDSGSAWWLNEMNRYKI